LLDDCPATLISFSKKALTSSTESSTSLGASSSRKSSVERGGGPPQVPQLYALSVRSILGLRFLPFSVVKATLF
jgi:hypothetical protein